ncbi:MAG TPA: ATPase, T2SS/T4P/T4SS family [Anaerohalosphaeraceae bacterium]|nr:ATPase, T2SS/T4P/T4SS family [Anaerohalosphaeraceae bacterium]HOL88027.1 ATPase, T2SS/T4P/T4SS family [Anaerohalosphaeraceae bacterium]HPP55275.1 ATPase, T2SS/T4P/T4SS family [Anaerohalosphaeraceae bacterium]
MKKQNPDISTASLEGPQPSTGQFGEWLLEQGLLSVETLQKALETQKTADKRLGQILVEMGALTDVQVAQALGKFLNVEFIPLDDLSVVQMDVARSIPETLAKRFCVAVVREGAQGIELAMADPLNVIAIDTVSFKLKKPVKPLIASEKQILHLIDQIYHGSDLDQQQMRDLVELEISTEDDEEEESGQTGAQIISEAEAEEAPVVRFVDLMLSHAIKSRASDIHVEPQEHGMIIRMRVDGILTEMVPPPRKMQAAVIARLKILAEMDIAERRLPQDGRFKIKRGKGQPDIDVRVSALPTIYGEKIVLRILDKSAVNHNLDTIGLEPKLLKQFKQILNLPHGIIIVTGPTGSGKSTTLYSALNALKDPRKNITTVEDPVEYRQPGINQTQVKPEINLDFALCLRAILRQDPDIILIGEIRDKETMEIAIKASLTGHLVLSTFHTNDAPSAISRLVYMGLEPYLLASSLNLILAQRLVRKICDKCSQPAAISEELIRRLKLTPEQLASADLRQGTGCSHCNGTGYRGRLPIFEFLVIDNEMRQLIAGGGKEMEIRALARSRGYGDLLECGIRRMLEGKTTPEEVLRVTFSEAVAEE